MGTQQSKIYSSGLKLNSENIGAQKTNDSIDIQLESIKEDLPLSIVENVVPFIISCRTKDDFLQFFEAKDNNQKLLVIFEFTNDLPTLESSDHQKLKSIYCEKSSVLLLVSTSEEKWSIYWKCQELDEFLELMHSKKLDWEENLTLCEFVANFVAKCVKNCHLGLNSQFTIQSLPKSIKIDLLADSRDFNMLLLAAEDGNAEIVKILLKLKMNTRSMDNKHDAQTLAMNNQNFDVVYLLLQNNLTFPKAFDISRCTGKLKEFCDATEQVHKLLESENIKTLEEILSQYPDVRHFYNFTNKSALMIALEYKSFTSFDFLLSKKFRFGSHENPAEYYEQIDDLQIKRHIRDIQHKYSQPFLEKHIHTLVANSTACFDETEVKDKHDKVKRAFELLSQNPFIKIILQIVVASKNFMIVFDFNREAVNMLDPTTTESTQGIFYFSGKIFIGAKQLLDPGTEHETLAVLIHELCHFAMSLVYKNRANPYRKDDKKTCEEFEEISTICEALSDEEEDIIGSIYTCYPEEAFHAELIVRVVHLMAFYRNLPKHLEKLRKIFIKLFEFYELKIVPELHQALPEIEKRDETELIIKDKEISKFKKFSIIGGILGLVGIVAGIVVALYLHKPTYRFDDLSVEQKFAVITAPILYKNIVLEFCNLFPENSTVYGQLTSDHITQMLDKKLLNLTDPHMHYLEKQISHFWVNLTERLKNKILNSNFNFQNESLKYGKLDQNLLNHLTSRQIVDILNGKELTVHKMIKNETKFFVERRFQNVNIRAIFYGFVEYVIGSVYCNSVDMTKANITFQKFYDSFINQNISVQNTKINEIQQTNVYKKCSDDFSAIYNQPLEPIHPIDFQQILKLANETKMFILSGEAGTGKTISFEQFTMAIKKKFPSRWVSYIDLKEHKHLYKGNETLNSVKIMLETIFGLNSKNQFERKIFREFFDTGNLILLWNGFDEISPQYSLFVLEILRLIRSYTSNIQLLCTRPLYSDVLSRNFSSQIYTLIPFDQSEQESFVRKFFESEKIADQKIPDFVRKVQNIVKSTGSIEAFDTPLMLNMIAELVANDVNIYETENLYEIYQKFVNKKIEIWKEKGGFALKFYDNSITKYRNFDMLKLYQSFAIKMESQINSNVPLISTKLKIMRQRVPQELTGDEISRMGILYINSFANIKFAHRTFAEFFIAQYLIENVYIASDEPSKEEADLRISALAVFAEKKEVLIFLNSYTQFSRAEESKPFERQIAKLLATKYQKFFMFDWIRFEKISFPVHFFKRDREVLRKLLQFNEDETYYTSYFRYPKKKYDSAQYMEIKSLTKPFLSEEEFQRFLKGKNQKGVILFSEYCNGKSINNVAHDLYKLDESLKFNDDPAFVFEKIANNLTRVGNRLSSTNRSLPAAGSTGRRSLPAAGSTGRRPPPVVGATGHRPPPVVGATGHRRPPVVGETGHRRPPVVGETGHRPPPVVGATGDRRLPAVGATGHRM